jgi:hypothetical protein
MGHYLGVTTNEVTDYLGNMWESVLRLLHKGLHACTVNQAFCVLDIYITAVLHSGESFMLSGVPADQACFECSLHSKKKHSTINY